ncbi:tripartite tricarboxylate transporter permease [Oceanobacillus jeddahense]|uniref:Tripartite tricarboxylate transporter permease n=1 Tax=Oceanobacillus jeddahense TaxID=1462527 RepID=A0ABY5JS28_9BACI|nr:tripartite tricarboxylate transporter permease [Oceanobacillus jeddahense]UUI03029.1 tripartite tricarboxylate transporter permease [Oceanobacillus jeddahense]
MSLELLNSVFSELFTVEVMLVLFLGVVGGIFIGALPGLSTLMAVALLIPVTFSMDPIPGLIMLTAVYTSSMFGGSIVAILLHTPGTPSSAATSLDGYPMTLKGQGAKAIGISAISSMLGGFFSAIVLLFLAPPLAGVSIMFSAPEYFLIAIFGLTIIGSLSAQSMVKGLMAGVFGLFIGTIGVDIFTGYNRFTFGFAELQGGLPLIPAMVGLFSISQVLIQIESIGKEQVKQKIAKVKGKVLPTFSELKKLLPNITRSSFIGTFVGILPGAGGDIASWVSYNEARRFSKNKDTFGKGNIEGVAAAETANNSVTGGSLIPTLTLGVPGSATTAVVLGGFMIHGLNPGNELFTTQANISYSIIFGFMLANILMGVFGLLGARYFAKVGDISFTFVAPVVVGLSVVGAYAVNNSMFDIWVMLIFGVIGYLSRKVGFHPAPIILGLILGPIAESGFRQSLTMSQGNLLSFYFSRPISVTIMVLIVGALLSPLIIKWMKNKYNKIEKD